MASKKGNTRYTAAINHQNNGSQQLGAGGSVSHLAFTQNTTLAKQTGH